MAKNIIYKPGQSIPAPVASGTKAGDPVHVGSLNGVAVTDRAKTDVAPLNADGTVNAAYNAGGGNANGNASVRFAGGGPVIAHNVTTAAAPTFGAPIYFDPAGVATKLTTTAGALAVFGHAVDLAPVNNGDGTFKVLVMIAAA